ncbi:type II secretion system protein GspJ [Reinekea sp.]|uniref:type II secretion system protein GspJ n=1 Tax=Reinekea sp. TaxID=1970455 RepID=UPI0039C34A9B
MNSVQSLSRVQGMTLIELLVALALSAVIAIGTFNLLHTSINTRDTLGAQAESTSQLSRAMRLLEQDFIQFSPQRPVKDAFGDYAAALVMDLDGLALTHNGWASSPFMAYERSTEQRVLYRLAEPGSELCALLDDDQVNDQGGCLIRSYHAHLDDDGSLQWYHQQLLRPLKAIDWRFLIFDPETNSTEFQSEPPSEDPRTGLQLTRLIGVEVSLVLGTGPIHQRIFAVPSLPPLDPGALP